MKLPELPELPPYPERHHKNPQQKPVIEPVVPMAAPPETEQPPKKKFWLFKDSKENLSKKEIIFRAASIFLLLPVVALDWYFGTKIVYVLVPTLFYLEVTAFTSYCPIKAIFSDDSEPIKYE